MGNSCKLSPVSSLEIEEAKEFQENNMNGQDVFAMKQRELNLRVEHVLKGDRERLDTDVRFRGLSQYDRAYGTTTILDSLPKLGEDENYSYRICKRIPNIKRQQLPTNIIDAVGILAKERRGYDGGSVEQWLKNMREEQEAEQQAEQVEETKQETEESIENENI
jgi:hypothetical protein